MREAAPGLARGAVWLQSTTVDNVVNYTVVVAVENPQKKLLPGMTARVEFLTESASGVLKVANAALRFKPADGVPVEKTETAATAGSGSAQRGAGSAQRGTGNTQRSTGNRQRGTGGLGTLYVEGTDGQLKAVRVRTGITDGKVTEVRGREVTEGLKIIAGTVQPQSAEGSTSSNPFQQQNSNQQRGPRPGGF